jgi:enoyl-[acyl-carrier protein] reductase I
MTGADRMLDATDYAQTIQAMGTSLALWTQQLNEVQKWSKPARIISLTSEGSYRPLPNYAAVSAAKATLEAITRSIAIEYAQEQITAICVQAGVTDTQSLRMIPNSEKIKEHSRKRNPNKRLGTVEDIANVVYLMALPEARWINGTVIKADGGEHLQ